MAVSSSLETTTRLLTRSVTSQTLHPAKQTPLSTTSSKSRSLRSHRRFLPLDRRRHISAYGYTQSKALVYSQHGEPKDVLSLHTHSLSPPTSSTVTLRMLAAPINPSDINMIQGTYPSKPEKTTALGTSEPSAICGNEGVAEVVGTGGSVKTLQTGDWVIMKRKLMGTWRTHLQVAEEDLIKIEDKSGLSPLQVGTVSVNPCTAYRMLKDRAQWSWGQQPEWFIQNAANSGVGRAAIQLAREWGIKSINVIRERPGWEDLKSELEGLGATKVVTEEQLMGRGFKDQVKEWTNGGREPIKLGLNCVGGNPATALYKLLSPGSKMVTYGGMSRQPVMLSTSILIWGNITFEGFWETNWSEKNPLEKKQTIEDILRLTREGRFKNIPVDECKWDWDTDVETLKEAVQGTLGGFRKGKGVFIFEET